MMSQVLSGGDKVDRCSLQWSAQCGLAAFIASIWAASVQQASLLFNRSCWTSQLMSEYIRLVPNFCCMTSRLETIAACVIL